MPRHVYETGVPYPARLLAADTRPIENDKSRKLALVRLEFEIFQEFERDHQLRSTAQIACRDLVLGLEAAHDNGVRFFAERLGVTDPRNPAAWSKRADEGAWVKIVFGPPDERDGRNRFAEMRCFSPEGYDVVEHSYELSKDWVTPAQAACRLPRQLRCSASKIRRFVNHREPELGTGLVRRTPRGHRRINFLLLRHLLGDPAWLDNVRLDSARRIRELERENTELKNRLRKR